MPLGILLVFGIQMANAMVGWLALRFRAAFLDPPSVLLISKLR
jgi:hypothetical protein